MYIVTPKPAETAYLPAELREIFDLLAAYGRKARLHIETTNEQMQQDFQKVIAESYEFLDGINKKASKEILFEPGLMQDRTLKIE